jgi:hypothetical protein
VTDKEKRLHHKRLHRFESFDRIELQVVPRYKTSGMSGDEWRQHVAVKFFFKGECVHETGANSMQNALMLLPSEWVRAQEPIPSRIIEMEYSGLCDQPSCPNQAEGRFKIKRETADNGSWLDPEEWRYHESYRQFCKRHIKRGDCSREDADDNYEPLDGVGPDASTNFIESPAGQVVVQVDSLDQIPEAIEAARAFAALNRKPPPENPS